MPGSESSLEELLAFVGRLQVQVAELSARVLELEAENAELRRRLGSDSTNSSKPPSMDGLG